MKDRTHVTSPSRRAISAILLTALLLGLIFCSLAFADEEGTANAAATPTFLPLGVDSADDLASLADGAAEVEAEPAANPLAAEELPHSDLGRPEAEELLVEVFGGGLEPTADFLDGLEVKAFRSDFVAVIAPQQPGADPGLLSSLLPLRVENEQGDKEPIDLALAGEGDHLEPSNSLVPIEIPSELSDGIAFPGTGIAIDIGVGETERQASEVGEATAFFPNIRTDSDFVITAIPTGVETYTQLRSPQAPTTESFDLTLPRGAEVREIAGGAQVVDSTGAVILSISAPSAMDAEEEQIPVSIEVASGNRVLVSVDPPPDAAYPILVDPVFENYSWMNSNTNTGIGTDWRSATQNQERLWPSWIGVWNQTMHSGLNLRSYAGSISPGSQATWNYYVPRFFSDYENPAVAERPTTFIRNMTLSQVYFLIEEGSPVHAHPFMMAGLWDENKGAFASLGTHDSTQGPYNGVTLQLPNPGEYTDVKSGGISLATYESASYPRQAFVGGAWVELSDKDSPSFGELGSVPEWVSTKAGTPINYKVTDPGIGIHNLRLEYTRATGITATPITGLGCTGNASSPCPRTASKSTNPIPYYPDLMAQGENWVKVYAQDAVSHFSEAGQTRIKVDRAKPELLAGGTLTEQAKVGANLSEYGLSITASDGDEAEAAASTPQGSAGTGSGQLERPQGLAVDDAGNTWLTDRVNQRVIQYDPTGKLIREINAKGSANGQLNEPRSLAVSASGNVWVAEAGNKRLQQFSPTGAYVSKITNASFVEPWGVAIAPDGTIWVTDPGAQKVFLFKEDGTLIRSISSNPTLSGGVPYGLDVDEFGNAWVALQGTDKVIALEPGGASLLSFGGTGTEAGKFKTPVDIVIAPSGNIFVSEDLNNRVQEFRPGGSFLRQFGSAGAASNQLKEPRAIDLAPGNELRIADAGNKRIARWVHADKHPESGAVKTEVKVDGVLKDLSSPGCATKNCAISRSWTLKADDYPVGTHAVEVIATDGVGLQTKKTLQVETHGDLQAPSVALSGTMTEQATLGTTRPTYKLKATATDPGSAEERKSGVASTSIKVDGVTVDSASPGCPGGGCAITREWTLNSSSNSVGSHLVEVKATDAAGRSTTKLLNITIERDTTPPAITLFGGLPNAPEGWVQQETKNATAFAIDEKGYGVKQIRLSIDGIVVGQTAPQTCPEGACAALETFTVNMAAYDGGAHPAVLAAEDLAGNLRKKNWTINVDPEGHISASEAEDTLEAFDATGDANIVGESQEEAIEGTAPNLGLELAGETIVSTGSMTPTTMNAAVPGGFTVEVAGQAAFASCANEPELPAEDVTGAQEEALAEIKTCPTPEGMLGVEEGQVPVTVTPSSSAADTALLTDDGTAAIASNASQHVDLITRPLFDGAMTFAAIRDSAAPESYSWEVNLESDQELKAIDDSHAQVNYADGPAAFAITAIPAHDAIGSSVPTKLSVTGPNIVTLTVQHHSLGPGGSPFVYPVVGGSGWEGGFETVEVAMPTGEGAGGEEEVEEEEERLDQMRGFLREARFGPPTFKGTDENGRRIRERAYNFNDCAWDYNGVDTPDGPPPSPLPRPWRDKVKGNCHGTLNDGYQTVRWAVSISGVYEYVRGDWVRDADGPTCKKWGPREPAKIHCRANSNLKVFPHLKVLGDYRFYPGDYIGGSPWVYCYRIVGVLPNYHWEEYPGEKRLEGNMHKYKATVDVDEACPWTDLTKLA